MVPRKVKVKPLNEQAKNVIDQVLAYEKERTDQPTTPGRADAQFAKGNKRVTFQTPSRRRGKQKSTLQSSNTVYCSNTCLPYLDLGDIGSADDILTIENNPTIAEQNINSLKTHDFAFCLGYDGRWTYSIIAHKNCNSILFVLDTKGTTREVHRDYWVYTVRLVNKLNLWVDTPSAPRLPLTKQLSLNDVQLSPAPRTHRTKQFSLDEVHFAHLLTKVCVGSRKVLPHNRKTKLEEYLEKS